MKLAVVGTGYVGLVSAACFAELGHDVIGVDIDVQKIAMLKLGKSPIYEPGLEELIVKNSKAGRLSFTTDVTEALPHVQVLFSAVATPPGEGFRADLKAVFAVLETVAHTVDHDLIFVNKSTVPVGTGIQCEERIAAIVQQRNLQISIPVLSNPEFLREGMAVADTLMPDRVVVGVNGAKHDERYQHAVKMMQELYRPITRVGKPLVFMSRESAEIVKYASNAFLATKISFINMMAELCEVSGGNVRDIAKGMGLDDRIGPRFLHAGIGYGGSCFPKDVQALLVTGKDFGVAMPIVEATNTVNKRSRTRFFEKILKAVPKGTIAVWGLAFKPKTDDMRDAPSLDLLPLLIKNGYAVNAFDPVAAENTRKLIPNGVQYVSNPMDAVKDADALVILTEWDEFRGIDLAAVKAAMKGTIVFDGRNIYDPQDVREAGLEYVGVGVSS